MPISQLPANGEQFSTTPATTDLVSNGSKGIDTEGLKSNPTFLANKRKREPVDGGDINDNEEKKLDGSNNDNVESTARGIKEVEMKDAEIDGSGGGIKEVEMQDAIDVQEKTIREEDHEGKVNKDKSECNEKQIQGVISDDEGKVNKDGNVRSNLNETDGCKQNQTMDKSECNEKEINNGQRALSEVAKLLKQVQETSDEKGKLEVDIKVIKKTDDNGRDKKENGNDNDQKVTRVSCP